MTYDEYKSLGVGAKIIHDTNGMEFTLSRLRMGGWCMLNGPFIDVYELLDDYNIKSLDGVYCIINHGLEQKYRVSLRHTLTQ